MRVLVTGGFGFIGSRTARALISKEYEVGVLDDLSTGDSASLPSQVESHIGDIREYGFVQRVVREYDAVVHEAAIVSVQKSVEDPLTVSAVNIEGTLNLLRASAKAKVRKFVFASSAAVYGGGEGLPKTEHMRPEPMSPYAVSKAASEYYCAAFAKVYGLQTVVLRYINVYGPGQKGGEYSGVIPTFIRRASRGKPPVIYGDGEQSRDFVHVDDVASANVLALERDVPAAEIFNIATGTPVTVNQLARLVVRSAGKPGLKPVHAPSRAGDILDSYADIGRAKKLLGYSPKFTIEGGLPSVIEWMRKIGERGMKKTLR